MLEDHRPGEVSNGQTIRLSFIVYVIGGDQIPGARHVLNHGIRISGNMFSNMTRCNPAVGVEASPGGCADDENDRLSLIEFLRVSGGRTSKNKHPAGHELKQ